MNTKKVIAAVVLALFTIPAFASAYTYSSADYGGKFGETLVEGHTVFAVIDNTICLDNYGTADETVEDCPDFNDAQFDVSYDVRANVTIQRLGTAVAVLVRQRPKPFVPVPVAPQCDVNRDIVTTILYENPGVLWFNDQFLVGDDLDIIETHIDANVDVCLKQVEVDVYPPEPYYACGGWVLATQAGMPDPRDFLDQTSDPSDDPIVTWNYVESYRIEDPNGYVWIIDKYTMLPTPVGVDVPVQNFVADLGLDDDQTAFDNDDAADGDLRAATGSTDGTGSYGYYLGGYDMWSVPVLGYDTVDPYSPSDEQSCPPITDAPPAGYDTVGSNGLGYNDNNATAPPFQPPRLYNAVLFFFFEDLTGAGLINVNPSGVKIHGEGGLDNTDGTGCESNAGGNSYDYEISNDDETEWECNSDPNTAGSDDAEGNSHPFNPNEPDAGPIHVHPTAAVDLYWHNYPILNQPADVDRKYVVYDTVGTAAPFDAHEPGQTFDDRVVFEDACADVDQHEYDAYYRYNGGGTYTGSSTYSTQEPVRHGEGETFPGDGANGDDCTGTYDGGTTGWDPSGASDDGGSVPTSETY